MRKLADDPRTLAETSYTQIVVGSGLSAKFGPSRRGFAPFPWGYVSMATIQFAIYRVVLVL